MNVATCAFCGSPINIDRDYRQVTGFERITRSQGGTNAVRLPDRSVQRFACKYCVDRQAQGISSEQISLYDLSA